MKVVAIGDIHGRKIWADIIKKESDADQYVIMGDYFDSYEDEDIDYFIGAQVENFNNILALKKKMKDKLILLFGNHDYHYLSNTPHKYSRYDAATQAQAGHIFDRVARDGTLQMCFIHSWFLFTHAGVTKTWCANNNIDLKNIEQSINDRFLYKPQSFAFSPGRRMDEYGDEPCQSPVWVRPFSLRMDKIDDYTQIVGHTYQERIIIKNNDPVVVIDALGITKQYLIIENGKMKVGSI